MTQFQSITLAVQERIATITLNRPSRLNAIDAHMPREIRAAVEQANETTTSMSSW